MRNYTACFSGHRELPVTVRNIEESLSLEINKLIKRGYYRFIAGGALGFDTLAAQTVLHLKKEYPHLQLILALPCETQSKSWSVQDQVIYDTIKHKADQVIYISKEYSRGCMHKRNRYMIDNSSVCICYLNKATGGTAYTADYAKKHGVTVINIV